MNDKPKENNKDNFLGKKELISSDFLCTIDSFNNVDVENVYNIINFTAGNITKNFLDYVLMSAKKGYKFGE